MFGGSACRSQNTFRPFISFTILSLINFVNMKNRLSYFLVVLFSMFLGSQITEAFLLVPYWQSLSAPEFYSYYLRFGPSIGIYYTILTIMALLIPLGLSVFYFLSKSSALRYSLLSALFAILFVACFYVYFKGTNELFYQSAFSESELKSELLIWSNWHWTRIGLEALSLLFLIYAVAKED